MKDSLTALRVAALWMAVGAIIVSPKDAKAQMDFSLDDTEAEGSEAGDDTPEEGSSDTEGGMDFDLEDADAEGGDEAGAEGDAAEFGEGGGGDVIGDLAAEGDDVDTAREDAPRRTETAEEIWAVQRTYALRLNRVELAPSAAFTLNDPYLSHPAVGVALNYWWTNVLALGVNFLWYQWGDVANRESDLNFFVRRSTRLAIPITEWQLGAYLNFTYVPFYGKFAVFNKFIFQWDAYVVGGVGLMRTRPVPVVDPEVREFDFGNRVAFNLGIGIRIFMTRFLGVFVEFRDYAYLERFENLEVSPDDRSNSDTWFADSTTFTNNVSTQVGFTLFFPFTFEYRLPK